jgi:hypothetical protein
MRPDGPLRRKCMPRDRTPLVAPGIAGNVLAQLLTMHCKIDGFVTKGWPRVAEGSFTGHLDLFDAATS